MFIVSKVQNVEKFILLKVQNVEKLKFIGVGVQTLEDSL